MPNGSGPRPDDIEGQFRVAPESDLAPRGFVPDYPEHVVIVEKAVEVPGPERVVYRDRPAAAPPQSGPPDMSGKPEWTFEPISGRWIRTSTYEKSAERFNNILLYFGVGMAILGVLFFIHVIAINMALSH